jgi:hypothetical protein
MANFYSQSSLVEGIRGIGVTCVGPCLITESIPKALCFALLAIISVSVPLKVLLTLLTRSILGEQVASGCFCLILGVA